MSEYKEEIFKLKDNIKIEKDKNSSVINVLKASVIDKIYINILHQDLTKLSKFAKLIQESKDKNLLETINILRSNGGEYLKKQGSIIYFLELMKERYTHTKIPQEIVLKYLFIYF